MPSGAGLQCVAGVCQLSSSADGGGETPKPSGVDAAVPDSGSTPESCGPCKTPPANVCENGETLRVYAAGGSCEDAGACTYGHTLLACADGVPPQSAAPLGGR